MFHVDEFLRHLQDSRLSPTTIRAYGSLLGRLTEWCARNSIPSVGAVHATEIRRHLASLPHPQVRTPDLAMTITRLRKYFGFLEREGLIFASPLDGIRTQRTTRRSYPAVDPKDLDSAFRLLRGETDFEIRARAILELAYSSALRPREIYSLRLGDIDMRNGLLEIRESKGNKDRLVPVGTVAMRWLDRYLKEVRPHYVREGSEDFVFLSHRTGGGLTVKGLWWALGDAFRRRGLPLIKPYSLRVSSATDLLAGGMGLYAISRLLGHAKVDTTQSYLRVETFELAKVLRGKHPRHAVEARLRGKNRERRHPS